MEKHENVANESNLHPLLPSISVRPQIISEKNGEIVHMANFETKKEDDEYGVYRVKHPTTYVETLLHMVKGNVGSGVFAMGDAYRNAGLILGPILTLILGVICIYGNHLLINTAKQLRTKRKLTYYPSFTDTMQWAFEEGPPVFQRWSKTIRVLVKTFNIITQLGFCAVYFVFIPSTIKAVLDPYGMVLDIHIHMVIIFFPILLTSLVRNLKFLIPFSIIANISLGIGLLMTVYISSQDLPPISSRPAVADFTKLPLFFGTAIFCFEGISMVLPFQNEMKQPEKFGSPLGVLNIGMTIVGTILTVLGFIGYLKYGEDVKGSLTLNFPPSLLSELVQINISIGIFFTYALQFYVAVKFIWPDLVQQYGPFKHPVLCEYGVRIVLVFITFLAAEVVPQLGLFISLLGAVSSTALALVFPPLSHIAMNWNSRSWSWIYLFDIFSLVLALLGFVTGTYFSLAAIIDAFFKDITNT